MDALQRLLISSLVALSGALVGVLPAHARCQIRNVAAIPVETEGSQLLTRGAIDGHPVRVLIDTAFIHEPSGGRHSNGFRGLRLIGAPRLRLFGLGGESPVDATFVEELQVGAFTVKGSRLPVAGDVPSRVDFIFGEDFLSRGSVEFDLRHGAIRTMETSGCTPAELPYWAQTYSIADLIASPRDAQAIRVNVMLNGHTVRAQIDSGSSVSFLNKAVADSVGVHYLSTNAEVVGIGPHSLQTWLAEVESFKLGDESINNTQLRVAQLGKYQTTQRIGSRIPVAAGTEPEHAPGDGFLMGTSRPH